jgi:hypothetical protein
MPILAFFSSAAGRWLVILLLVGAACAYAYVHGRQYERGIVDGERLKDADAFVQKLLDRAAIDRAANALVADALDSERAARSKDRQRFEERLRNVPVKTILEVVEVPGQCAEPAAGSTEPPSRPREDDRDRPRARLSADGCKLWNDALAAGATAAERPEWIAGADTCSGPVEIDEALRNLRDNAELLGECRKREELTQEWFRKEGFLKMATELGGARK